MGCSGCGGRSYTRKTPAMPIRRDSFSPQTITKMSTPVAHAPTYQPPKVVQSTTLAARTTERRQI